MPFTSSRRHEYWTTDVRYVEHRLGGNIYVVSVLENHSRAILASGIFRSQDLPSYLLSVLYSAVERYGSAEAIVTDGGAIFRANQALSIYEALNIDKEEIAGPSLVIVHRDHLQHPAQDGRLALRKGRELARTRGHS